MVLALGGLAILAQAVPLRLTRRRGPRRIVYLGTGQIAQVFPRNGVNLFLERECSDFDGYFEQMWNVHFPAAARGEMSLTPRHHLVDVDFRAAARTRALPTYGHGAARSGIPAVAQPFRLRACAARS